MECDEYEDSDEMMWLNEEPGHPGNYFKSPTFRGGFRRGGHCFTYNAQVFNQFGPFRGPRFNVPRERPGFYWGRGYGPAGPPKQHTHDNKKFLLQCGVLQQTLSEYPDALLRLMDPESCGVCAQEIINFDVARLHYSSKNHVKNVKKWLIQQDKVAPQSQRTKEMPFKARGLYCELCDIHITSKSHADTHYAGRPHRAVVLGRKPPKNPILLQKNMQRRVDKLIRREQRYIKPIEKPAEVEKPKPDKNTAPELYCEICQTMVTCTEQMTMHLNGRKHLSKEKRHILNMMNGETPVTPNADVNKESNNDKKESNNVKKESNNVKNESNNVKNESNNVKNESNNSEGDDWGETWDDDPK
ncbi:hypothetical protein PYW07_014584 [Mythimna separata]|uniref:U1-type domain-containing protein n=1 Tax=Mythimna separata TaxID=271217 RepID=A0AAD8DZN1_MYTSE|nr:hypothetical protein PYW07_014584 [Mythimna separata]